MKKALLTFWLLNSIAYAQVITTTILPSQTDPAINTFSGPDYMHVVYIDKAIPEQEPVIVFLPGTNGKTGGGQNFNMMAAAMGYKVISLIYPDDFSLSRYKQAFNVNNYDKGREEIITGKDMVSEINVDRANSIENRLLKLLVYLNKQYPTQGWSKYYDGTNILWDKIIVAGQSQGGGHAAYIAKFHKVSRVLMFGSPKDFSVSTNRPPHWIVMKSETPINCYFSFVHSADDHNGCTYPQQQMIWKAMGLYTLGAEKDVDVTTPPYNNVHLLTSTKSQANAHTSVIRDTTYSVAWKYMLTAKTN